MENDNEKYNSAENKRGILARLAKMIWESMTKTGGCCGSGECCGSASKKSKKESKEVKNEQSKKSTQQKIRRN